MDPDRALEHQQLLSRRDRLRAERQAVHSRPTRVRLRLGAVIVIITVLISWMVVSWFNSASSSGQSLPEPELTGTSDQEQRPIERPGENHHGAEPDSADPNQGAEADEGSAEVIVHVAGAVDEPQVVHLEAGARVSEAIEAAGGFTGDAAAHGVNLAAEVVDASFIWVPTEEEFSDGEQGPPAAAEAPGDSGSASESSEGLININTADADQLQELPGVGPALAERIITYREANDGFGSLDELAAVSGIGPAILENVADSVEW